MKLFYLFFLSLLVATPASSKCRGNDLVQRLTPAQEQQFHARVAAHQYATGNIWHANKGNSNVFVIGISGQNDSKKRRVMKEAKNLIDNSDALFVEDQPGQKDAIDKKMSSEGYLFIKSGPTLEQSLSRFEWERVKSFSGRIGIPPDFATKMKPWIMALTMGSPECDAKSKSENSMDTALERYALGKKIPVAGLGDSARMFEKLEKMPHDQQIQILKLVIKIYPNTEDLTKTLQKLYLAGQHRAMIEFILYWTQLQNPEDQQNIQRVYDRIVYDIFDERTKAWVKKLLPKISSGTYVVAVGAGHLSGKNGILQLLNNAGYKLSPHPY